MASNPKRLRFYSRVGTSRVTDKRFKSTYGARQSMQQIIRNYAQLIDQLEGATPEILYDALEPAFELSQYYCPVDSGAMKASGYLEIREWRGHPTVEIGYGKGGEPSYTARVHENMEWNHKEPTRAKWLQAALTEMQPQIQASILSNYRSMFK